MFKVLSVVDKEGTAIDRLAKGMIPYHDNIDYQVVAVHPKRPDAQQLAQFEQHLDADIIAWDYFRTAEMLRSRYDIKVKQILTHYNPYSIKESDWNTYDHVVACNKAIFEDLGKITTAPLSHIPLTVDTDFWTYKREWQSSKNVLMVANRIESKKGILQVAKACSELKLKFHLVGAISDADYFREVAQYGINYHQEISDEELRDLYWTSDLLVCNSVDGFESGTLPILEAMLSGCPVLTREIGHVPELNNGSNMIINEGTPDDVKPVLEKAMASDLPRIRERAWDTAKTRSNERRAYMYQKLYREVMWPDEKPVTVVMPSYGGPNYETIDAVLDQNYHNLELIWCNDDPQVDNILRTKGKRLLRTINQPSKGYGLAKQRNLGVIEATGEVIVFCDQRMLMDPQAVQKFVDNLAPKRWVYGNKGVKKEFVENFSAVYRDDLIKLGLFNERIDRYGGMSQEIRSRAKMNGFKLEYVEEATATPQGSSKNKYTHRQDIIKMKNRLWKMDLQL